MKKSIFLVAATMLFTVALAACSSKGNNSGTTTPGAFGPGGTSQPGSGLEGTPTESTGFNTNPTQSTGLGTTTTPSTGVMTETQSTTQTQSTNGGAPVAGSTNNQMDAGRASSLLKFTVVDQAGNKVGSVNNLVINFETGKVDYILVSMGGVLGIGARQVAVPCELFQFPGQTSTTGMGGTGVMGTSSTPVTGGAASTPATGTTGNEDNKNNVLILTVDKATLDNAPKFDTNLLPKFGMPANDWDTQLKTYWSQYSGGTAGAINTPAGGVVSTPVTGMSSTPVANATPGVVSTVTVGGKLQGVVLADQLLKLDVTDGAGKKIASVKDIVIDTTNFQVLYVVIDYSGATGTSNGAPTTGGAMSTPAAGLNSTPGASAYATGGTYYPVPLQAFTVEQDGKSLALSNASTLLTGAPSFTENQFPNTMTPDWDKDIKAYWLTKVMPTTP